MADWDILMQWLFREILLLYIKLLFQMSNFRCPTPNFQVGLNVKLNNFLLGYWTLGVGHWTFVRAI